MRQLFFIPENSRGFCPRLLAIKAMPSCPETMAIKPETPSFIPLCFPLRFVRPRCRNSSSEPRYSAAVHRRSPAIQQVPAAHLWSTLSPALWRIP